jgi:hypothetical protein
MRPNTLQEMLTYRRPGRSRSERKFINRYIIPRGARPDLFGNLILQIGDNPRVMWSSHTDTVHTTSGRQQVELVGNMLMTFDRNSSCLGADCTTGVWLMLRMIDAGKPGLYIFHRDEESGCRGSNWIAKNTPELLDEIDYAIAFDRRGYDSVVTHQMGGRCASDAFANDLLRQLGFDAFPDPTGVYTDTVSYEALVPECTNISVGYFNQHSRREQQDMVFAYSLLDKLLALDVSRLPVVRDPNLWEDEDELVGSAADLWLDMTKYKVTDRTGDPTCWECQIDDSVSCPECKYARRHKPRADLLCAYCDADLDIDAVDTYFIGDYELCKSCYNNSGVGV